MTKEGIGCAISRYQAIPCEHRIVQSHRYDKKRKETRDNGNDARGLQRCKKECVSRFSILVPVELNRHRGTFTCKLLHPEFLADAKPRLINPLPITFLLLRMPLGSQYDEYIYSEIVQG